MKRISPIKAFSLIAYYDLLSSVLRFYWVAPYFNLVTQLSGRVNSWHKAPPYYSNQSKPSISWPLIHQDMITTNTSRICSPHLIKLDRINHIIQYINATTNTQVLNISHGYYRSTAYLQMPLDFQTPNYYLQKLPLGRCRDHTPVLGFPIWIQYHIVAFIQ